MYAQEDDLWEPDFIRSLVEQLEIHPDQVMAMSATNRIDEDGNFFDTTYFNGLSDVQLAFFAMYNEQIIFSLHGVIPP